MGIDLPPVIELQDLWVRLGGRDILRGLSCRVGSSGRGSAVGLLGPNGAGKSTLIRTLLGFHRPHSGVARVLGHDCHTARREVHSRVGFMPETDAFIAELPAITFVRLMAELSGLPQRAALEQAHAVLFHVGLGEARYRQLGGFSYGMRQSVKLAQAIVHGPELVLLDEPTNGLDPAARQRMLRLIRELKDGHGMAVVLCSHLLPDVEEVCDEVLIMNDGLLQQPDLEAERRSNRSFVDLEVTGDDRRLAERLAGLGAVVTGQGSGRWRVVLPPELGVRRLWALLAEMRLDVRKLTHRADSLEQVFLRAIGRGAGNDGTEAGPARTVASATERRDGPAESSPGAG